MSLIGLKCKHGDVFSLWVLIGRGLFLLIRVKQFSCLSGLQALFCEISFQKIKIGVNSDEVTPVPIPNTEVKLICDENTWLATAWEDNYMPVLDNASLVIQRGFLYNI